MNEQQLLALINQIKDRWGRETVFAIISRIQEEQAFFTGTLERSVIFEQDTSTGDITFFMADYGEFLDEGVNGTDIGRGSKFSFRGNWKGTALYIKQWANAKGLNEWATARSIQKKGIEPRRFFTSVIERRIAILGEEITQGISDYMTNLINAQQRR